MIPCVMIGDSIAVGVGQARPECETIAQVGIGSAAYIATLLPPGVTRAGTAVISLGVNDGAGADTLDNLREVRGRIQAPSVVWLLPGLKERVREMIRTVAAENGDRTLDTRPQVGRDHLHPTGAGYEQIATTLMGTGSGVEVAYAPDEMRRPLRAMATPRERIRRLRAMRQVQVGHAQVSKVRTERGTHAVHSVRPVAHVAAAKPRAIPAKLATACTTARACRTGSVRS